MQARRPAKRPSPAARTVPPEAAPTTRDRLVRAALDEFCEHGFQGTDSNRIARRAGFAPQTFYRWFADKTAVFLAAYQLWEEEERRALAPLSASPRHARTLVEAIVAHHRGALRFRRSLRQLAVEDAAVRTARAESRRRQIDRIRERYGLAARESGALAASLLQLERLADGIAEGEFADLGCGEAEARLAMQRCVRDMMSGAGEAPRTTRT